MIRIFCANLPTAHDKFCICICPLRRWFFFINSEPPQFRRAREAAVEIQNFELLFLRHLSFVDTTSLAAFSADEVETALADSKRQHGPLPPMLRERIKAAMDLHAALTQEERAAVVID